MGLQTRTRTVGRSLDGIERRDRLDTEWYALQASNQGSLDAISLARRLVDRNLLLTRNLDGFISSILKWCPLIDIWAMLTRIIYRIGFGGLYEVWQGRFLFVFEDKFDTVMNRGRRIIQCKHKLLYS